MRHPASRRVLSALVLCTAIGIAGLSVAYAAEGKPSRVHGKVTASDGKPASGITVQLAPVAELQVGGAGAGTSKKQSVDGLPKHSDLMAPAPIKTVKTDQDGAYDMPGVPVGNYKLTAGVRSAGIGYAIVDVEGDGNDIVQDVTLNPPKN